MATRPNNELTPRERQVLELLKLRWRNKEIAAELVISENTVETHVRHALAKLGHRTRQDRWDDMF